MSERTEHPSHTSVEATLPRTFPHDAWPGVLAVLESADWFGLSNSTERGRQLWAAIRTSAPAAPDAAEGPHVQP